MKRGTGGDAEREEGWAERGQRKERGGVLREGVKGDEEGNG